MIKLDYKLLSQYFSYNPDTGVITWLKKSATNSKYKTDDIAGSVWGEEGRDAKYLIIHFKGSNIRAHRLAWTLYHQHEPKGIIDHINRDGLDNRISNLRDVNHSENMHNCKKSKNNTTGVTGVYKYDDNGRYQSRITIDGNTKAKLFNSKQEAVAQRIRWELEAWKGVE